MGSQASIKRRIEVFFGLSFRVQLDPEVRKVMILASFCVSFQSLLNAGRWNFDQYYYVALSLDNGRSTMCL